MRFTIAPVSVFFLVLLLASCLGTRSKEESGIEEPAQVATATTESTGSEGIDETGSTRSGEGVDSSEEIAEPVVEPPPPEPEVDVYAELSASVAIGDMDSAISKFEEAFSDDPEDSETKILYSNLQLAAGLLEDARTTLEDILNEEPENTDALFNLALIASASGNEEEQLEILSSMIEIAPDESRAYASLGELSLRRDENDAAIENFGKSIEIDPDNIVARAGMGNVLLREERYDEAIDQLDAVIELDPEYEFTYVDRSRAKLELDNPAGAEADLTVAIELSPDFYWHYVDRGRIRLLGTGDADGALEDFERAIEIDSDYFYPYIYRGLIFDRLGRRNEAIEDYYRVLSALPDYYYLYEPIALDLYAEERWSEAIPFFEKTWEMRVNSQEYAYPLLLALSHLRNEDRESAEEVLTVAISSFDRDSLEYQIARLMLEPGYDAHVTTLVSREADGEKKTRMLYYLAAYYLLENRISLGTKYLLEVVDKGYPGMLEHRISQIELERYR